MNADHFLSGIHHLEIMLHTPITDERKRLYYEALKAIPDDLWTSGCTQITQTAKYFPMVAEIGEACIPGAAVTEVQDPFSLRWAKRDTPWPVRLARLTTPKLPAPKPTYATIAQPPVSAAQKERLAELFQHGVLPNVSTPYVPLTPEQTEAWRHVLHRQLLWLSRREAAERNQEPFTEPRPI